MRGGEVLRPQEFARLPPHQVVFPSLGWQAEDCPFLAESVCERARLTIPRLRQDATGWIILVPACHYHNQRVVGLSACSKVSFQPFPCLLTYQRGVSIRPALHGVVNDQNVATPAGHATANTCRKVEAACIRVPLTFRSGIRAQAYIEQFAKLRAADKVPHPAAEHRSQFVVIARAYHALVRILAHEVGREANRGIRALCRAWGHEHHQPP